MVFLNSNGSFCHGHIVPLYLERYQPEWEDSDTEKTVRDKLLLEASRRYKGDGSLDELWYFTMDYRGVMERKETNAHIG